MPRLASVELELSKMLNIYNMLLAELELGAPGARSPGCANRYNGAKKSKN
jgi:hypothetical protein